MLLKISRRVLKESGVENLLSVNVSIVESYHGCSILMLSVDMISSKAKFQEILKGKAREFRTLSFIKISLFQ